jgi:hypothetical protein
LSARRQTRSGIYAKRAEAPLGDFSLRVAHGITVLRSSPTPVVVPLLLARESVEIFFTVAPINTDCLCQRKAELPPLKPDWEFSPLGAVVSIWPFGPRSPSN